MGVTGRQLQRWEGAVSMPTWRNIQSLAEVLGVEPSVVAGIVGPDEQVSERDQLARVQSDMAVVQARVVTLSAEVSALRELLGVTTPAVRPLAPSSADGRAA